MPSILELAMDVQGFCRYLTKSKKHLDFQHIISNVFFILGLYKCLASLTRVFCIFNST